MDYGIKELVLDIAADVREDFEGHAREALAFGVALVLAYAIGWVVLKTLAEMGVIA